MTTTPQHLPPVGTFSVSACATLALPSRLSYGEEVAKDVEFVITTDAPVTPVTARKLLEALYPGHIFSEILIED